MTTFRRILCPVDFSECSRHALDQAVAIARWYGGTVTALHAVHPIPYADPLMASAIVFTPEDFERIGRELTHFVGQEMRDGTQIETLVVEGTAVRVILEQARRLSADLIVMGTHGRSGFERFMLGSVTERVLRRAACPVLTVPPRAPDAAEMGPVVFDEILCGTDFSPASAKALAYASSLAGESGAHLTVMHVVEPAPVYEPVMAGGGGFAEFGSVALDAARVRLHDAVPHDARVTEAVVLDKPYRALLDRAKKDGSDLIVIGAHGGLADRLGFFGSTMNHVVREATCPVLSLRG